MSNPRSTPDTAVTVTLPAPIPGIAANADWRSVALAVEARTADQAFPSVRTVAVSPKTTRWISEVVDPASVRVKLTVGAASIRVTNPDITGTWRPSVAPPKVTCQR